MVDLATEFLAPSDEAPTPPPRYTPGRWDGVLPGQHELRELFTAHLQVMVQDAEGNGPSATGSESLTRQQLRDRARAYLRSARWHPFAYDCGMDPEIIREGLEQRLPWMTDISLDAVPLGPRRRLQDTVLAAMPRGVVLMPSQIARPLHVQPDQVAAALKPLVHRGLVQRLARGLYIRP